MYILVANQWNRISSQLIPIVRIFKWMPGIECVQNNRSLFFKLTGKVAWVEKEKKKRSNYNRFSFQFPVNWHCFRHFSWILLSKVEQVWKYDYLLFISGEHWKNFFCALTKNTESNFSISNECTNESNTQQSGDADDKYLFALFPCSVVLLSTFFRFFHCLASVLSTLICLCVSI